MYGILHLLLIEKSSMILNVSTPAGPQKNALANSNQTKTLWTEHDSCDIIHKCNSADNHNTITLADIKETDTCRHCLNFSDK